MSQPEKNLRFEEKAGLLEWIHQFAPYGVLTLDKSLRIQSWNNWMEMHSGKRAEDVAGKKLDALFPDLDQHKLFPALERALDGQPTVLSTTLHRYVLPLPSPLHKTEEGKMLQTARIAPLLAGKNICGVVMVIEDVTQREYQADALRKQHRRDKMLAWALAYLLEAEEPRKTVRQLFFKLAENLDFDTFWLYLRDVETGQLKLYTSGGLSSELEKDLSEHAMLLKAAESRETMILNSIRERSEPEFELFKTAEFEAAVTFPLFVKNRSLGMLCLATWSRKSISLDESDFLKTMAQYLATAVDRENANIQLLKAKGEIYEHSLLLEKRVEDRTARLHQTLSEIETFSYTLAHDLKAPVRGMTGYCQALLEDFGQKLPVGATLIIKKLMHTSRRMDTLIRDMLAFSRVSREEIALSKVELEPLLDDIVAMRSPAVRDAITIRKPLEAVKANPALLQQVIANLVDNAVKFVEPGKTPEIIVCTQPVATRSPSIRSGQLLFSSTEPARSAKGISSPPPAMNGHIRIWVSDQGIGIAPEAHQKIFSIFERGHVSEVYEGTGIGLAIVARATQRMGGTCGVESDLGHGSRFWVELPAA